MERSEEVMALRAEGLTPKEIARRLGMRPAEVTALVQQSAQQLARQAGSEVLAPLVGCFVNRGWSDGLGLDGAPREWTDAAPQLSSGRGLVGVLVGRRHRYGNVMACGYLVDVFCLGVKDTVGPKVMNEEEWRAFVPLYFRSFDDPPVAAPLELAQCLVLGGVDYAHSLGFEPHVDFTRTRPHLGEYTGKVPITFGDAGRPSYISGPRDDTARIFATLQKNVGAGNFEFLLAID